MKVKDVNYYGLNDEYVMSGSDDGVLFICRLHILTTLIG